jgi:PadR family transcriptional regulator, regulatory protein PadR
MTDGRPSELVQGTLDMLILRILSLEPMRGYGIGVRLEQISRGRFRVNAGSLSPAFRRLERDGFARAEWQVTENGRRAKYDHLAPQGRAHLKHATQDWDRQALAIGRILRSSLGEL